MFERFTDRSRRVVVLAAEEARMLGHGHIGTEHLLLGLLHEQSGIASRVLRSAGVTIEEARAQVAEIAGRGDKTTRVHIPFTARAKRILELSLREALELGQSSIKPEHVLLGLIRERDGVGAQVAARLGEPLPALRQRLVDAIAAPSDEDLRKVRRTWAWPTEPSIAPDLRMRYEPVVEFRHLISSLDRRLTNIEEHFGIPGEPEMMTGFRGLLVSVDRHLARIERHLGISPDREREAGTESGPEGETTAEHESTGERAPEGPSEGSAEGPTAGEQ